MLLHAISRSRAIFIFVFVATLLFSACAKAPDKGQRAGAILDTAFTAMYPSLADGIEKLVSEQGGKVDRFELSPLTPPDQIRAMFAAAAKRLASPSVLLMSPLVYSRLFINPPQPGGNFGEKLSMEAIGARDVTVVAPLLSGRSVSRASLPKTVFIGFNMEPAYKKAGSAIGRFVAQARASGDARASCSIVFSRSAPRNDGALAAFQEAFRLGYAAAAGDIPDIGALEVFPLDSTTVTSDYSGSIRSILKTASGGNARFLFIAADALSVYFGEKPELGGIPTAMDVSGAELMGNKAMKKEIEALKGEFVFTVEVDPRKLLTAIASTLRSAGAASGAAPADLSLPTDFVLQRGARKLSARGEAFAR